MTNKEDVEPNNKNSFAYFEWLKRENARQLRKAGHKAMNTGERVRIKKTFNKPDETKIRELDKEIDYGRWCEIHDIVREPLEANPDLWEDDVNNTVD